MHVIVHDLLIIEHGGLHVADLLALLSVKDITFRHVGIVRRDEHRLNAVLDVLHADETVLDLFLKIRGDLECQQLDDIHVVLPFLRFKRLADRFRDLGEVKIHMFAVSLDDLIHSFSLAFIKKFLCF